MTKANRKTRRERFTVAASCGSNRGETNSRSFVTPRCSARANSTARTRIASSAQNHIGAPKLIRSTSPSRQFLPNGLRQYKLSDQQTAAAHEAEWKQIAVLLIFFHGHGRFFHLIDVAVNLLERFGVGCPEKLAIGNLRNLSQAGLVKFHALVFVEQIAERVGHRTTRRKNWRRRDSIDS